jgi:hypothetical protein
MFINVFRSAALAVLVAGSITAADDPFVGKWKYNQDKSKVTGQHVKIDELAPNKYKFDSGAFLKCLSPTARTSRWSSAAPRLSRKRETIPGKW